MLTKIVSSMIKQEASDTCIFTRFYLHVCLSLILKETRQINLFVFTTEVCCFALSFHQPLHQIVMPIYLIL